MGFVSCRKRLEQAVDCCPLSTVPRTALPASPERYQRGMDLLHNWKPENENRTRKRIKNPPTLSSSAVRQPRLPDWRAYGDPQRGHNSPTVFSKTTKRTKETQIGTGLFEAHLKEARSVWWARGLDPISGNRPRFSAAFRRDEPNDVRRVECSLRCDLRPRGMSGSAVALDLFPAVRPLGAADRDDTDPRS